MEMIDRTSSPQSTNCFSSKPDGVVRTTGGSLGCGQHLLHRPAVDAEPPNRGGTSPAPRHNRQGAMDGEFLRRRDGDDRPRAPPRVVPYSSAVYTSTITASPHCTSRPGSGRPTIFRTRSPAIVRTLNSRNALPIASILQWIIALTQSAMGRPALRPLFRCPP